MKTKVPRHIGIIPDGNRRWAQARGLPKGAGYAHGIKPGLRLYELCRQAGIAELSVYGFTQDNVKRPVEQVAAFREACTGMAQGLRAAGAAVRAVGDAQSPAFPPELRAFIADPKPKARLVPKRRRALDILTICKYNGGMIMDLLKHKDYMRVLAAVENKPVRFGQLQKMLGLNPTQVDRALSFLRKGLYIVARTVPTEGERIIVEYRLGKRGAAFLESYKSFEHAAVKRKAALGPSEVAELQSIYR